VAELDVDPELVACLIVELEVVFGIHGFDPFRIHPVYVDVDYSTTAKLTINSQPIREPMKTVEYLRCSSSF